MTDAPPLPPVAPYDLVIRGGLMHDPAAGVCGPRDVAIAGSVVAAVAPDIPAHRAKRVLDAGGRVVLPGLIDLHTHTYPGYHGADPDRVCLPRGTTTAVDGGSSGANAFSGFRRSVVTGSRTRLRAWLNISTIGLIEIRVGELNQLLHADAEAAVRAAEENRDLIVGIKIRISEYVTGADFKPALRIARTAADEAGLPLMVHIGDTNEPLTAALPLLRPGDVVTHTYTGRRHGIFDYDGAVLPAVRQARESGVRFDGAHGRRHFSFDAARRALEQGFPLDTLSSDISVRAIADTSYHLPLIMSKLMALGASLDEVVPLVTRNPARILGAAGELGTLVPGAAGDVAILEVVEADVELTDSEGQRLRARRHLVPWRTVRAGEVVAPAA
jgi:dihydroorotase